MSNIHNSAIVLSGKTKGTVKENAITIQKNIGLQVDSASESKDVDDNESKKKIDVVTTGNVYNRGLEVEGEAEWDLESNSVNIGENIGVHVRDPLLENTEQENMRKGMILRNIISVDEKLI